MKYILISPPLELAAFIKNFWILEAKLDADKLYHHRLFADACPTIVFHYQNLFSSLRERTTSFTYSHSVLHGHTTAYEDLMVKGAFGIFGITLFPWSLGPLFQLNPQTILHSHICLSELLGKEGNEIEDKICSIQGDQERLTLAVSFLISRINKYKVQYNLTDYCIGELIKSHGNQTIENLAHKSGWSRRHLERRFVQHIGLSPKQYARVLRFQHTIRLYERGHTDSLTHLAYEAGFFDQSHMNRDFKIFSGLQPKRYFRKLPEKAEGFARMN